MKRRQLLVGISTLALATPIPRQAPAWWHALGPQAPPLVTGISPNSGVTTGNTPVTISGAGFTHVTAVKIGGVSATGIVVVSSTSITAVTPGGTVGSASVVVTTLGGSNAPNTLFSYTSSGGLPTGLLQSTPLGGGAFAVQLNRSNPGPAANADGTTTGWSTGPGSHNTNNGTIIQIWWDCPADQIYQFVVPSFCASLTAVPANGLQVHLDQLPLPSDLATTVNKNWFYQFINNPSPSQNYGFTAPVKKGLHSIQIYMGMASTETQSGIHCDRLNIIGTGLAFPAEPLPQDRDPIFFPYSSLHFFNTPFGANAQWLALNNPIAQQVNGTGGNGASIGINAASFSSPVWIGQPSDPVFSLSSPNDIANFPTSPTGTPVPCRLPAGAYPSLDHTAANYADSNIAFIDSTNPRYFYSGIEFETQNRGATGILLIGDNYNLNHAPPQSAGNYPGLIRVADLDSGVIAHRILGGLSKAPNGNAGLGGYGIGTQTSQWSGMPWPACESDFTPLGSFLNNPNGVPYGSIVGIPPQIVRPAGLNTATAMMWDAFQNYGVFLNVSVGSYPGLTIYAEGAAQQHPLLSVSWSSIVPNLSVLSNPQPIVVGQGLGGGSPRVALRHGLPQGSPSIGRSPYTFPSSPVGIPIQVAQCGIYQTNSTGAASQRHSLGVTIPVGSLVFAVISHDRVGVSAVNFTSTITDSAGNTYNVIQPPGTPITQHVALAVCLSTTFAIASGRSWTANLTPTGVVSWYFLGAYYRPAPPTGSTLIRASNSAATASGVTTLSTTLANLQTNDLIVAATMTNGYAEITDPAGMGSLLNSPPMTISFDLASSGTFTYTPTWDRPSGASIAAVAFANANIAT